MGRRKPGAAVAWRAGRRAAATPGTAPASSSATTRSGAASSNAYVFSVLLIYFLCGGLLSLCVYMDDMWGEVE